MRRNSGIFTLQGLSRNYDGVSFANAGPAGGESYYRLGDTGIRAELMDAGGGDQGRHFMQAVAAGYHGHPIHAAHESDVAGTPFREALYVLSPFSDATRSLDIGIAYVRRVAQRELEINYAILGLILAPAYAEFGLPDEVATGEVGATCARRLSGQLLGRE